MGFQQGLSGLNASSKNLEVIGNNIANANTFGAKASRAEFADVYANAIGGSATRSASASASPRWRSSSRRATSPAPTTRSTSPSTAAASSRCATPRARSAYSRNGQFKVDRDGFIVNNQGSQLMGYPADATGTIIPGAATALQMPTAGITPAGDDRRSRWR